jgi:glycosyltransferase involved in cell wall biosynthesis
MVPAIETTVRNDDCLNAQGQPLTESLLDIDRARTEGHAAPGYSVVYLVYREMLSSIIPSQVIAPLAELRKSVPTEIVAHVPVGHLWKRQWRAKLDSVRQLTVDQSLPVTWLAAPPPRAPWLWSDSRKLRRWLKGRFQREAHFVLHCRGAKMTRLALQASAGHKHGRIIYDARGDEIAETYDMLGLDEHSGPWPNPQQHRKIDAIRASEQDAITKAHGVTAVSQSLLNTLQSRQRVDLSRRSLVIPCCPDIDAFTHWAPRREAARTALGLTNKFVVCYLGSLAWYQMPELSLRVFRLIRQLREDAHFLAITTQSARMEQIVRENGIAETDFTIRSFTQSEVPRWLVAADLGLMLRKQDAVNRAASPVKFGEYLAAGVPVVISQDVGDSSDLVKTNQLGCVVDIDTDESQLLSNLQECLRLTKWNSDDVRLRCRETAARSMSWPALNAGRREFYASQFYAASTTRSANR